MSFIGNNPKFNTSKHNPLSADPVPAVEGQQFFSDGTSRAKGQYVFKNGAWTSIGQSAGSLEDYYSQDFEGFLVSQIAESGNNATFGSGGTLDGVVSLETSNPIDKTKSLLYTVGTTSLNDYIVVETASIQDKQRSRTNALSLEVDASDMQSNFDIVIYDETNSAILESLTVVAGTSLKKYNIAFNPLATTLLVSYGIFVNVAPTASDTILIDDAVLTTDPFVYANINEENVFSAYISNNGSVAAIISQTLDFIDSVSYVAAGIVDITLKAGFFVETPVVTGSVLTSTTGTTLGIISKSTTTIRTNTINDGISQVNKNFMVTVVRQGLDYRAPTKNVVTPAKSNVSDWESFDPFTGAMGSISQGWGTPTNVNMRKRRDGSDLLIQGSFNVGTAATLEGRIAFDAVLVSSSIITGLENVGYMSEASAVNPSLRNIVSGSVSYMNYGNNAGGGGSTQPENVTDNFSSGERVTVSARIPIEGWTAESQFLALIPTQRTAYIKDVKPENTDGGTFTNGAWRTRDLNTIEGSSSIVSLSSNQFTLQAGIYVFESSAPANYCNAHKTRLRNITDSTTEIIGTSEYSNTGGSSEIVTRSFISGEINITEPKIFELQHRAASTRNLDGFGEKGASFGESEIYAQIKITKIK